MLWQIGMANIKLAEKRQLGKKYQLRICLEDGPIQRQICWVKLIKGTPEGNTTPDIDLYCGLSNLNEHFSCHAHGDFHRKQTGLNSLSELGEKAGLVLMWATWKRQRLSQIGSHEPVLSFMILNKKQTSETFPQFTKDKKHDVIEIDTNKLGGQCNGVTVKIGVAKKSNFSILFPLPLDSEE